MNLVIIAPEFPPRVGGMEVHALHTARYLASRHRVTLFAPPVPEVPAEEETFSIIRVLQRQLWKTLPRLLRQFRILRPDALLSLNAGYSLVGRFVSCPSVCRTVGNDLYSSWVGPHLPLRKLFWSLPTESRHSPGRVLRRLDQRYRNRAVAWGLRSSRLVLANSRFTRTAVISAGVDADRIRVMVGGVDVAQFNPGSRSARRRALGLPDAHIICTAARLVRKKGVDTVLRALPSLVRDFPDLIYLVLGDGPDRNPLQELARTLGVAPHVRFLGSVEHERLADYYGASDIYVQCSKTAVDPITGSPDVETMGRAVCEASACGVPVLVSNSGGLPDVVQEGVTGLVVAEDSPPQIESALRTLLSNSDLRERMGTSGAALAKSQFSWETVGAKTENALDEARQSV